jgi:hypothetical protein
MSVWEKAILNMQKGSKKITTFAATFSERVNVEIALVRLRIRIDEAQAKVDALHQSIGKRLVELKKKDDLPKGADQLFKNEEFVVMLAELEKRETELTELRADQQNVFLQGPDKAHTEGPSA